MKISSIIIIGLLLISCGKQIDPKSKGYYRDRKGIYFSPGNNWFELGKTYLHDVDVKTFIVLDYRLAKDKYHVYSEANIVKDADAASFHIDSSGIAKDKFHVFIYDNNIHGLKNCKLRPVYDIDIETVDRPIHRNNGNDWIWLRDKNYVYLHGQRQDVDRNTFQELGDKRWFIDKNRIYDLGWNSKKQIEELNPIDSIQIPLETIPNSYYLRNGRNLIYWGEVVVRDIDIHTIERMGEFSCVVNDMILHTGKTRLKDTVDVITLQIIDNKKFWKDKNHVYHEWDILEELDAVTFRHIENNIYEDKMVVMNMLLIPLVNLKVILYEK